MNISLKTHSDRLAAIESLLSQASVMESATLIELANRLCREDSYVPAEYSTGQHQAIITH